MSMDTHMAMTLAQQQIEHELLFSDAGKNTDAWLGALSAKINYLIVNDFHSLVAVLYRLDVSEKKLQQVLKDEPEGDAGRLIALAIVERQLQKIHTREQFQRDHCKDFEEW